jgi:uncharacterized repeat protein (TIGR01451 family)
MRPRLARRPDRSHFRLSRLEVLEDRRLLAVAVHEFPIPGAITGPVDIASGPDGNLWFTDWKVGKIGMINPTTHAVNEFPIPTANSVPEGITAGPDGNLWFAESDILGQVGRIGMINPTTHAIAEFPVPTLGGFPEFITSGPDGNLWFSELFANNIGMIDPTTHAIKEFPVKTAGSDPEGITAGSDGNLWFTERQGNIGMINPTSHVVTEFHVTQNGLGLPGGITAGPDGNIWFTGGGAIGNTIGMINPTTHAVSEFPAVGGNDSLTGITSGPDGNLWFTIINNNGDRIGMINPTTHAVNSFPIPTIGALGRGITTGPDANIWFTEGVGKIGQAVLNAPPPVNADLALSGNAPGSVTLGANVTYTLTIANAGPSGATGVTLTDTLSAGVTFVSATGGVTPVNGVLTFNLGSLAAGAPSVSKTIIVKSTATGVLKNTASLSANEVDSTPADNAITQNTTVKAAVVASDLALSGSAPGSVTVGDNLTYTLTIVNAGPSGATGVTLTDTLPAGVTFVSATGGVTPVNGVLTFNIGSLAAGAPGVTKTIVVRPTATGTLENSASVNANESDSTPGDNALTRNTTVNAAVVAADLALSGTAPSSVTLGKNVTYTLTVANGGPAGATGVKLIDTLPAGVTFVSATGGITPVNGVLMFNLGNLAANAPAVTKTIVVRTTATGALENSASVSANETDSTMNDNALTQNTTVRSPVTEGDGPIVVKLERFGIHFQPTVIVLTFNEPLDAAHAQDTRSYRIIGPCGQTIEIDSAVYDPARNTVTLRPHRHLNIHQRFHLTVVGTGPHGLTDTSGCLLDGARTGRPGSNYRAILDLSVITWPDDDR